jgi:hypothetical protein
MNIETVDNVNLDITTEKKRGRKTKLKQEIENKVTEHIEIAIEEKKKTQRKKKEKIVPKETNDDCLQEIQETTCAQEEPVIEMVDSKVNCVITEQCIQEDDDAKKTSVKKRGRKPKGGKIVQQIIPNNNLKEVKPNVILHLKCSSKDLINNSNNNQEVESYAFMTKNDLGFEIIQSQSNKMEPTMASSINNQDSLSDTEPTCKMKEVWIKLKELEHNLHINNISNKRSACFWCTYDFDNPPIYIPKHFIKDTYHVYGCFCSPECSVAYLMNENIDSSTKFERYHFINHIYTKIYNYTKNIKPAPNPYYMLEKYYGNLNIQEYRSLLRNERLFLIVDKPLTRILPELHEDNDEFILNNKIIPSNNTYQIKKKNQKKSQVKNNIVNEQFGLS